MQSLLRFLSADGLLHIVPWRPRQGRMLLAFGKFVATPRIGAVFVVRVDVVLPVTALRRHLIYYYRPTSWCRRNVAFRWQTTEMPHISNPAVNAIQICFFISLIFSRLARSANARGFGSVSLKAAVKCRAAGRRIWDRGKPLGCSATSRADFANVSAARQRAYP